MSIRVETINTGTELLLGQVTDSHLSFLGQSLFGLGMRIERQVIVPDGVAIAEAFEEAMARAQLIIVTGGLGPTSDDITRDAAAEAFGHPLKFHQEILDGIGRRFASRNIPMNDLQRPQAMVPAGAVVLANNHGTAPGLILRNDHTVAILLPGPPRELRPMWENEALPWLRKYFASMLAPVKEAPFRTLGIGESEVQLRIEKAVRALGEIEIGYCARPGEVDLRLLTADADLLQRAAAIAREKLGHAIYAESSDTLPQTVVRLATAAGKIVATAESCTGGLIASRLTDVEGSSGIFRYGWVAYNNEVKIRELGVPAAVMEKFGVISDETARAMAEGALRESGADFAVAVTGIAGPDEVEGKPAGQVHLALAQKNGATFTQQRNFRSTRDIFKYTVSQAALDLVRRALLQIPFI